MENILETEEGGACANSQAGTPIINSDNFLFFERHWRRVQFMVAQSMRLLFSVLFQRPMRPTLIALTTTFLLAANLYTTSTLAQTSGVGFMTYDRKACELVTQPEAQIALGEAVDTGEAK